MKVIPPLLLLILLLLLGSLTASGQEPADLLQQFADRYTAYAAVASPEKAYLHTDKETYSVGETLWLKGYLLNKSTTSGVPESRFLYVELLGPDSLVSRIKLKESGGNFCGHIPLPYRLATGTYSLQAYTRSMLDEAPGYLFRKEVQVINGLRDQGTEPQPDTANTGRLAELKAYPEGGRYLPDREALVAVKANDRYGRGVAVTGTVYDGRGQAVTSFATTHAGMGVLSFRPAAGERYYAEATDGGGAHLRIQLPKAEERGITLSVRRHGGSVLLSHHCAGLSVPLYLLLHDGSRLYYKQELATAKPVIGLPEDRLQEGIHHAVVVDARGAIYAERLFFVYPPPYSARLTTNGEGYGKRERVDGTLVLKDGEGRPLQGDLSLTVTDLFLVPRNENAQTIASYLLLASELRGEVESPGFYFRSDVPLSRREAALDLLMLVQGWRYYDLTKLLSATGVAVPDREYAQRIAGKAVGSVWRRSDGATLSVTAPAIGLLETASLGDDGQFLLEGLDFPENTLFLLAAAKRGAKSNLTVELQEERFAPYLGPNRRTAAPPDDGQQDLLGDYRQLAGQLYALSGQEDNYLLEEAVVRGNYRYRPKHNPSPYNESFSRSQVKEREDLESYGEADVWRYLQASYPFLLTLKPVSMEEIVEGKKGEPHLYIDGFPRPFDDINYITLNDVENLVVMRRAQAGSLYGAAPAVILVSTRRSGPALSKAPSVTTVSPWAGSPPSGSTPRTTPCCRSARPRHRTCAPHCSGNPT